MDGVRTDCNRLRNAIQNGNIDPHSISATTTGGYADFSNAGWVGLFTPTTNRQWVSDPTKHTGPPKLVRHQKGTPIPDSSIGPNGETLGHWEYSHAFLFGFAFAPDPQSPTPISPEELGRIRSDVEKAINAKKCADFLKTLLDEAAVQTGNPYRDIMVTFDNTQFFYGGTKGFGGLAPGSFEDGTAKAYLFQFQENFISADRSSFIRTQTAQNALAETLHHVGTHGAYDDAAMASALNAIYVRRGKDVAKTFSNRTLKEVTRASNYWHPAVMNICSLKY